jgi:hypothetical protein
MLLLALLFGTAQAQSQADLQPVAQPSAQPTPVQPEAQAPTSDLESLLGALRKAAVYTVRGEASINVIFPPGKTPLRRAGQLPPVPFVPGLIGKNFGVVQGSPETIAGRPARVFTLTPNNALAPRWRLWIDTRWNVPLAYEERSADGSLARRAELLSANKLQKREAPLNLKLRPGLHGALLQALPGLKLPGGFRALSVGRRGAGPEIILSDGVNVLALVLAQKGVRAAPGVASRKLGSGYVWLVGNVEAAALSSTLGSIKRSDLSPLGTFLPPGDSNP